MKKKIILSLLLTVCLSGLVHLPGMEPSRLRCEGAYPQHLQGFDGSKDALFWSFTVTLVKTDLTGKKLLELPVRNHHGDLCVHDNKVYVIANYGKFNNPAGLADNHVMIYDTASLKLIKSIPLPEVKHGGGAIARTNNGFMITGGLPGDEQKFPGNILYEYDNDFKFIKQYTVPPWTLSGVQTLQGYQGGWILGCHRSQMMFFDRNFQLQSTHKLDVTHGIMIHPANGKLYYAVSRLKKGKGWIATAFKLTDKKLQTTLLKNTAKPDK